MDKLPPILYAEDNENDIELTLAAFEDCHIKNRIDVVRDGQEVIDYLRYQGNYTSRPHENPIVILLDIKMPRVSGIDALQIIKSDDHLKLIPVVILTSSSMDKDILESYNLGVNAYVVKPVSFEEFMQAVKKLGIFWALVNQSVRE
ncbi:MAG: response regulator [Microscillaceae bacterium]|nr:response regulator [Microscillaceae bacterium]